jgi:hypothetical protein
MRWWADNQLMLLLGWMVMWRTIHLVLGRSTPGWGCQSILFLAFFVSADCIIRDDGVAD